MVCLGNICRSPMAEGVLRQKALSAGLNIVVDSAGTANYHAGEKPDYRAISCMQSHDIDISNLRARQFTRNDFDDFDFIFTMDAENHDNVMKLAEPSHKPRVRMLLNEIFPKRNMPVPDPWFGSMDDFQEVYSLLDRACDVIIEKLKRNDL